MRSLNYLLKTAECMKFSELYRKLEDNGWIREEGKRHAKYVHPDFETFVPVGRHPSKEVPTGTLNKILKDTGLK